VENKIIKTEQPTRQAGTEPSVRAVSPDHALIRPVAQLQRAVGNQAVGRFLQAKLQISRPGDQYEQEADRVADQVMRMPDTASPEPVAGSALPQISRLQRKCSDCEEEEVQRQATEGEMEEEEETLQAKEAAGQTCDVTSGVQAQIDGLRGRGEPLSEPARAFFEPRFGQDFSQVRVHTDGRAAESARALNALAYTVGQDVVFGAGQYAPDSPAGRRLLAHELTHTIQQQSVAQQWSSARAPEVGSRPDSQTVQRACPSCEEEMHKRQRAGENCPLCEAKLPKEERKKVQQETARIKAERERQKREARQRRREEETLQRKDISAGPLENNSQPDDHVNAGMNQGPETVVKIQQVTSGPSVQRVGFWENVDRFFGGGTFSDQELQAYLTSLRTKQRIEDDFDSDNKAREVVGRWKRGDSKYAIIPVEIKILLIKEMLSGFTGDDDEGAILDLLRGSTDPDFAMMLRDITVDALNSAFHWAEQDELDALLAKRGAGSRGAGSQAGRPAGSTSPQIFSEEGVSEAHERFMENALLGDARSHCIQIIHEFLPGLFAQDPDLQARVTRELRQLRQKGETYTIDHTGEALRSLNLASPGVQIFFSGNSSNHRVEPGTMESSAWEAILGMVGPEIGWHIFGMSLFNGFHSVTVFVNNRADGKKLVYWADQWAIARGDDFKQAEGSVSGLRRYEKKGFDDWIDHFTHSRWCTKSTCDGAHWRATLTIWKFYSSQVQPQSTKSKK
jgi:hypothetical protein